MQKLLRRLWYAFRHRRVGHDLTEELAFHLDMKQQELEAAGHDPQTAAAGARRALGNLPLTRNRVRDVWVWPWFQGMSLDFKLGLRMLVKYPGLTVVGGLAMAFGFWAGVGGFEVLTQMVDPTLPLDDGHRIVGIQNWHTAARRADPRALHDFVTWRDELESVDDLGAFRPIARNLITEGSGEVVEVAQISASAFRVARVPPLLGRALVEADEAVGAPPVVVIGYDVWQARFGGDPDVVGRTVGLGNTQHTVAGVMPEGFAFPVSHSFWVPLRLNVLDHERGQGPAILVFGRLAPGVSLGQAQAQLTTIGARATASFPDTHEYLQPRVMPYARSVFDLDADLWLGLGLANAFLVMLLVLACANVALLMFARAATRESEIDVRDALGASHGRIIMQLFVEALVLAGAEPYRERRAVGGASRLEVVLGHVRS